MFALPEFGIGTVIWIGVFLGMLLFFEGLRQLLSRREDASDARNRRMRMIAGGATPADVLKLLRPQANPWTLHRLPFVGDLPQAMRRAGMTMRPGFYLATCLTVALTITLAGALRVGLPMAAAAGLALGLILPVTVVRVLQKNRIEKMTAQLPDALELMARGLRVGHPMNTTIGSVARDMSDPIATEFGIILDQVAYGDDLVAAFADLAQRIGTEDARYLATSVAIQNGTGSDLSRILVTLSKVIRGRINLRKRVQAISAEGRMTAGFLSILPVLIVIATSITAPTYYPGVAGDPLFRPLALIVLGLVVTNFLAMRHLVNFRV